MKIIVALDSLKGCLSASDACKAVAEGILQAHPNAKVIQMPLSDGGEGLTDVLRHATKGQRVETQVHGPLMEPLLAHYAILGDQQTAGMEMAITSGLPLVPQALRNPMNTTTFGFGELIADAMKRGIRQFILGIGGSATNDAGLGMLQALGYQFFNRNSQLISEPLSGKHLFDIEHIDDSRVNPLLKECTFTVACDVQNPLYGPQGAAYIFGPQKGADAPTVALLDEGLKHFAQVTAAHTGKDNAQMPGAGAAGGLGFALTSYLNATLKPGINLVLDTLHFHEEVKDASLVITGEGKSDRQTLMGKVAAGILNASKPYGVPVILMAGCIEDEDILLEAGFHQTININAGKNYSLETAMKPEVAAKNLKEKSSSL